MPKNYIIGTRGSLLALTQTKLIRQQLEELTGDSFELKVIKTEGDLNTSVPLWQMEGKDFFTKELDQALLNKEVDLVVHSYKDLGSERPKGIKLGAITKRQFAHDILLIKKDLVKNIHNQKELIVGTSSPRRVTNIEASLNDYLPTSHECQIKTEMLRGNVNTRIKKLKDGQYDAIVLALAGLERLATGEESQKELQDLLNDLTFMILPQSIFPSSASQGALGIECFDKRDDDGELLKKLKNIEDAQTVSEVSRERSAFTSYGGGCHLAVGINVKKVGPFYRHIHRGKVDDKVIDESHLEGVFPKIESAEKLFVGFPIKKVKGKDPIANSLYDEVIEKVLLESITLPQEGHFFVTSTYCLKALDTFKQGTLWSAGTRTHQMMVQKGLWVHGCADALGDEEVCSFMQSKAIKMMREDFPTYTLTNDESQSPWGESIACYTRKIHAPSEEYLTQLKKCDAFYWTSYHQYQTFLKLVPEIKTKLHTCGLGKTYDRLSQENIQLRPFSEMQELKRWALSQS